mmetsp:Transcript_44990/g.90804  ORF Transcript_44990/g.90804 Transcript_44990/m.90804 type:complete len:203 (-) Transcript_44990:263-871(-)
MPRGTGCTGRSGWTWTETGSLTPTTAATWPRSSSALRPPARRLPSGALASAGSFSRPPRLTTSAPTARAAQLPWRRLRREEAATWSGGCRSRSASGTCRPSPRLASATGVRGARGAASRGQSRGHLRSTTCSGRSTSCARSRTRTSRTRTSRPRCTRPARARSPALAPWRLQAQRRTARSSLAVGTNRRSRVQLSRGTRSTE